MKIAQYHEYGPPDVLKIEKTDRPKAAAHEIVVRVKAISVNPIDTKVRSGQMKWLSGKKFPQSTGFDFSGEVIFTGKKVKRVRKKDEVFGYLPLLTKGSAAELIKVPVEWVATKPKNLSFEEAAAMPCTFLTALQALKDKARIKPGDKVLIYGASGGVGTAAIQMANYFGAEVHAVCSTGNVAYCKELGAHRVIDYHVENVFDQEERYDIIFQVYQGGGSTFFLSKGILKPKGRFVTLGFSLSALWRTLVSKIGIGTKHYFFSVRARRVDLNFLADLVEKEIIRPRVQKVFPFNQIHRAHQVVEMGHTQGKVVVKIG